MQIIDVSKPTSPRIVRTFSVTGNRLEIMEGIAYVTNGGNLTSIDIWTGAVLQTVVVGGTLTDVVREGQFLYTMDNNRVLRAVDLRGPQMVLRGSVTLSRSNQSQITRLYATCRSSARQFYCRQRLRSRSAGWYTSRRHCWRHSLSSHHGRSRSEQNRLGTDVSGTLDVGNSGAAYSLPMVRLAILLEAQRLRHVT